MIEALTVFICAIMTRIFKNPMFKEDLQLISRKYFMIATIWATETSLTHICKGSELLVFSLFILVFPETTTLWAKVSKDLH